MATRIMRRGQYPLNVTLTGVRVDHLAQHLGETGRVRTACRKIGTPGPQTGHTCKACEDQPWSQDQRNYIPRES